MTTPRRPSISTGLFSGSASPAPVSDQPSAQRASGPRSNGGARRSTSRRRPMSPAASEAAAAPIAAIEPATQPPPGASHASLHEELGPQKRSYLRLHLYATQETLDQVKALQGHALIAGVKLGARGPSLVMAAALDALLALPAEERIDAIRWRLDRDEEAKELRQAQSRTGSKGGSS